MSFRGKRVAKVLKPDCTRADLGTNPSIYMKEEIQNSEDGFYLEELITDAVNKFPVLVMNLRENQIKQHFQDNSLNGVDHWIKFGSNNILIQDKWKESVEQQEVSQFLECASRLNRRIPRNENIYLLWVSKYQPTKNSIALLNERGAEVISCSLSVESLARLAILRIAECLGTDPVPALLSIPKDAPPLPIERVATIIDEEALEILKIRKELNEKKKLEEEEEKLLRKKEHEEEIRLKEVLKKDEALVYKVGLRNGHGDICPWIWDPTNTRHLSVKEMLKAEEEVQEYRTSCIARIEGAIQRAMEILWSETTDESIIGRDAVQNAGGCGWSYPDIRYYLGTKDKTFKDEDYWQACILEEFGIPLFNKEYNKWYSYCQRYLEINKGRITRFQEAQKEIKELKEQVHKIQRNNEMLEEKLESIRRAATT